METTNKDNNAIDQAVLLAAAEAEGATVENPITQTPVAEVTPQETIVDILKDTELQAYITLQIKEGIADALRGIAPRANGVDALAAQQRQFEQMTYKERLQLFNTNPQQYYRLAKKGSI